MSEGPILSTEDVESFTPPGSLRCYRIAPLSYRERVAFKRRVTEEVGILPSQHDMFLAMRAALAELNPPNLEDMRSIVDGAHAIRMAQDAALMAGNALPALTQEEQVTLGLCLALEARLSTVPLYAALLNQREAHHAAVPYLCARFALRGWEGPGLPEFAQEDGLVPEALMEALDRHGELLAVGWRAHRLAQPGSSAVGNGAGFASPSPLPATPTPAEAETALKTAASGGSRGKNGKPTRAS